MAQYLLSVHGSHDSALPEGVTDVSAVYAAVEDFNSRLMDAGAWVFAGGLVPASEASVVHPDGTLTDGPRLAGEEHLGGFWVIEAPDDTTARTWAREALATKCSATIEVRKFQG